MSLADSDASFWGEDDGDQSGRGVSGVGDVNGDGFDDFIIGAHGDDDGGYYAGQTYLILGNASGWAMDTDLSAADASFWGEDEWDVSGIALSGAGDVNGDGFDDFLIGSYRDETGGNTAGHTYLILGKAFGWTMDTDLSDADASFRGEDSEDYSGLAVSGAGDVNGDGFDDFLIGAYGDDDGGESAGQTYLILGKASGWAMDTDLFDADASFWGEDDYDYAGSAVSGAGDVNGDGFDDILIGAYGDDDGGSVAGQTYLILGKASGWAMDTDLSDADASFWGEGEFDFSSMSVSGTGDVNGDGFDDFLIGADSNNDGGNNTGQTYLILGKASGWVMDTDLSMVNASFLGEDADDRSGFAVSGAGDVNGDGFDDFIIGAHGDEDGGSEAGQTYLILGRASGWAMDTNLSVADASFWGEDVDDRSGLEISGAGDVNGDGLDDILIGAFRNAEGGTYTGQTYLIFPGRNTPPTSITSLDLYYPDGTFARNITSAYVNDAIHVRVNGTGGNSSRRDITEVTIASSITSPFGFRLRLLETTVDSNTFDGYFELSEWTHERHHWIGTIVGETVSVTSVTDPTKWDSLLIRAKPKIAECPSDLNITEDIPFSYTFTLSQGTAASWTYGTNMFWWQWNASNATFWGTPTNRHVGTGNVQFFVRDDNYHGDHVSMNITVVNVPAEIIGEPSTTVLEDTPFSIDFDSTDDSHGTITWHLDTAAKWLEINETTGVLSGVPTYLDAGVADISVSVDDGNGGWDFRNFTIEVIDIVDIPIIITEELPDAIEDEYYTFQLEVYDPDYMDFSTWSIGTNATWLEIGYTTGLLFGTPGDEDVGEWTVGIIVADSHFLQSSVYLTLKVLNVNDLPSITTEDQTSTLEDVEYRVGYEAADQDVGNVLTWSLETLARWLNIDESTGVLSGTPTNDDIGSFSVTITVSDGEGGTASHEFILEIIDVNDPPEITSDLPPSVEVFEDQFYNLDLLGKDEEDGDVAWSDDTALFDISPGLGTITFTPSQSEVGEWWVNITAEDSEGLTDVILIRFVVLNVNDAPEITSISPEDGAKYKEGKTVTFTVEATDEDGDYLTVTWTSDGVNIGTGDTLDHKKLKPGTRAIKVTVSDGEASVEDEFTVVITKEEESPMLGGAFVLLAMLVGMAAFMMRRKGKL